MRGSVQSGNQGLEFIHPTTVRLLAHAVKPCLRLTRALSPGSLSRHSPVMEYSDDLAVLPPPTTIVKANLARLQKYAKEWKKRGDPEELRRPGSDKALAIKADVSRKTLYSLRKEAQAIGIDTLFAIAQAYGLQAYQMLIPNLDPANPVTLPVSEAEAQLWRDLKASMQRIRDKEQQNEGIANKGKSNARSSYVGSGTPRAKSRKKVANVK